MPRFSPVWRRNTAHSAGERVSALIAEISTDNADGDRELAEQLA